MSDIKYEVVVVLEGVEFIIEFKTGWTCDYNDAVNTIKLLQRDSFDYLETDKGILAYNINKVKSIYFLARIK